MVGEMFRGTRPQIFATNLDNPEEGRIFVWAWTEWFERLEGTSGDVAFSHVADTEEELRRWLSLQGESELDQLSGEWAETVKQEFIDEYPLYPEAPELTTEEPFREDDPDEDVEHG